MSQAIAMDFVWEITDDGELSVDVTPKGHDGPVLGNFTFDQESLLEALDEDIERLHEDPTYEMEEWIAFRSHLLRMFDGVNTRILKALPNLVGT